MFPCVSRCNLPKKADCCHLTALIFTSSTRSQQQEMTERGAELLPRTLHCVIQHIRTLLMQIY